MRGTVTPAAAARHRGSLRGPHSDLRVLVINRDIMMNFDSRSNLKPCTG